MIFLLLLIAGLTLFLRNLKKKSSASQSLPKNQQEYLVLSSPLLSSVIIILSIFQFVFPMPPFVFTMLFWTISVLALTFIFRNFISKYWKSAWFVLLAMFFLAIIDNLTLQASRIERYAMLLLSLAGAIFGLIFLIGGFRKELKEKGVRIFLGFFILMELIAAVANLYGRYNFSKSFLTSGIFGLTNAVLFFWVIRLINEMLTLADRIYKKPDKKTL